MKSIIPIGLMFATGIVISGCVLGPEAIAYKTEECKQYGLIPVIHIKRDLVKRVSCIPEENEGYIFIEKGRFEKLPKLPRSNF